MCRSRDETSGCDNRELHMIWGTVSRNTCFWSCEGVCCWSTVCWRGFWLCQCLGSFCDMEHTLSDLLMPRRCWNFGCLLIQWWRSIGQLKDVNILVGQKDISQVLDLPFPRWIQFERFRAYGHNLIDSLITWKTLMLKTPVNLMRKFQWALMSLV